MALAVRRRSASAAPRPTTSATANRNVLVTPGNPQIVTTATVAAELGDPISDSATISGLLGNATGNIVFTLFGPSPTPVCTGTPIFTSAPFPVSTNTGSQTVGPATFSPDAPGLYYWIATYTDTAGGNLMPPRSAVTAGETSAIADANIEITPATDTNPVGTNHVLTITVNALGGTLGAGTATASIVSGPGSFVGLAHLHLHRRRGHGQLHRDHHLRRRPARPWSRPRRTSRSSGLTITRTTSTAANTAAGGSGNASKIWVDANIQITPATDTNAVGTNHVLTITVNALGGTLARRHRDRDASSAAPAASSARPPATTPAAPPRPAAP